MTAYYNEIDPHAAAWLRELIRAGEIAPGIVDERSIEDARPDELLGYTQCHFFAGIGGWSLALRLAGVPDDYPIWTGSCPCQPFSAAGKGAGFDDERHLWPSFQWLIQQCRPPVVAGEQVASKATGAWFDLVQADLEAMGYAFGLIPFPAAGIGAPHIRDRAYWVADASGTRSQTWLPASQGRYEGEPDLAYNGGRELPGTGRRPKVRGVDVRLANGKKLGRREEYPDAGWEPAGSGAQGQPAGHLPSGAVGGLADTESKQHQNGQSRLGNEHEPEGRQQGAAEDSGFCGARRLDNATSTRHQRQIKGAESEARHETRLRMSGEGYGQDRNGPAGPTNGHWRAADWLLCRDGKWRPVEPGTFPLVDGIPRGVVQRGDISFPTAEARAMRLKGYGNAIVPQQAAIFIQAALGSAYARGNNPHAVDGKHHPRGGARAAP